MNNQPSEKFKGVIQLLKESWAFYHPKIKTILGIIIMPVGFEFLSGILIHFLKISDIRYSLWFSIIWAFISLISLFLWFWAIPSLLFSIKEEIGVKEAYQKGLKMLIPYIRVYFLLFAIIIGGLLLFIIPGILFLIWFSLAIFALVFEERKGMNALFRSQHLIAGKFWGVLRRFLGLGLIILIGLILVLLPPFLLFKISKPTADQIGIILGYFLELLVVPFVLVYGVLIYKNLEKIKEGVPYQEPTRKRKLKYLLPGILGSLILFLIIGFNFLNVFLGRDIPPVNDSDLRLSKIEIPKEKNAFYDFVKFEEKIYLPKEKKELFEEMSKGEKWDSEFAKELIEKNEEAFSYFENGLKRSYFQFPEWQDPKNIRMETPLYSLGGVRNMAKLNSIKASYLFKQGKKKEAFDLTIQTIKMGQLLEESPRSPFITYLVGMGIKDIGLQKLRIMIPDTNFSVNEFKKYITELNQLKASKEGLIRVLKMDYISFVNSKAVIDVAIAGKLSKEKMEMLGMEEITFPQKLAINFYYKPNKTQKLFIDHFRNSINNVEKNYNEIELFEIESLVPDSRIKMMFTENIIGKMVHDIVMVSYEGIFSRKCEEDFSVVGTQILLALKAYQIENGKLPNSLDELVPEYLSELPLDSFDGKPIRYSPDEKIIYSFERKIIFPIEF